MALFNKIGTNPKPLGLTCWSVNPAAQQRRPATECANVVMIFRRSSKGCRAVATSEDVKTNPRESSEASHIGIVDA